jgi:ribosomal protein L44E
LFTDPFRASLAPTLGRVGVLLRCVECGAESDEFARGWRAYRLDDLDVWDEDEPEISMYCPECARREFGAFRWEDIR